MQLDFCVAHHKPLTMHELNSCRSRRVACEKSVAASLCDARLGRCSRMPLAAVWQLSTLNPQLSTIPDVYLRFLRSWVESTAVASHPLQPD